VSFAVDLSPQVIDALSRCSPAQQDFFRHVRSILQENPYRFRDVIQRNVSGDGRVFYQYYDGIIPLVFLYRVFPPEENWDEGQPGYVFIRRAHTPSW
jgi:hypothetical protein